MIDETFTYLVWDGRLVPFASCHGIQNTDSGSHGLEIVSYSRMPSSIPNRRGVAERYGDNTNLWI